MKTQTQEVPTFESLSAALAGVGEAIAKQMGVNYDPDEMDLVIRASEALVAQNTAMNVIAENKQRIERGKMLNLAFAYIILISLVPLLFVAIRLAQLVMAWTP